MDALLATWRAQGVVTVFTRFHPLLDNVLWGTELSAPGPDGSEPILPLGETVAIDLRPEEAQQVGSYRKTLRQEIARARRAGMTTRLDEDWSGLEVFADLYRATMVRNRAEEPYYFTVDDFRRLKAELGSELHLLVTEMEGRTVAAGLFMEHRGIVQAHLVGTDDEFRAWSPLKLLLDDVRRWASERGNHLLHLGGGRSGRDDSLLSFKRRFSPLRFRFAVGRWVLDPDAYSTLVSTWEAGTEGTGHAVTDHAYFPAYRSFLPGDDLEFHLVGPADHRSLIEVFADIDETFFRPHPFTAEEARRVANHSGRDVYGLLEDGRSPVAYGMLRGWDEGYSMPSLGIAVRTSAQGRGYGRRMLGHLHDEARRRGAQKIRLRVHPDNVPARRLYESFDYQYEGEDRGELVMIVELSGQAPRTATISKIGTEGMIGRIAMSAPDVDDADEHAVRSALRSGVLGLGPRAEEFERLAAETAGVTHGVAVSSGTAGLHLLVRALGIGRDDEVLVPSFTFAASVNAFMYEGATPVFVDIEPETYNLRSSELTGRRTSTTKAVMAVDVFGHPADWDDLAPHFRGPHR